MLTPNQDATNEAVHNMPSQGLYTLDNVYIRKAVNLVGRYVQEEMKYLDPAIEYRVFVVWFCKTLQHWKALVSTTLPDGMYYEVIYNGDTAESYVNAYKAFKNKTIPDD